MARRSVVVERDRGWREMKARMRQMKGARVKVGVISAIGFQKKKPGKGQKLTTSKPTLVQVAFWNEFGTESKKGNVHVPARSFVRSTHDENRRRIRGMKSMLVVKIQDGLSVQQALEILGQFMKARIEQKIVDLRTPANAPSTKKRKGSSNPLVDIGQLHQGIGYMVVVPLAGVRSVHV